jgi:hypothetical protein
MKKNTITTGKYRFNHAMDLVKNGITHPLSDFEKGIHIQLRPKQLNSLLGRRG